MAGERQMNEFEEFYKAVDDLWVALKTPILKVIEGHFWTAFYLSTAVFFLLMVYIVIFEW